MPSFRFVYILLCFLDVPVNDYSISAGEFYR